MTFTLQDLQRLQAKLQEDNRDYQKEGARVGILIDPDRLTVTVYRFNGEPLVLANEEKLTISELFPGWEVSVSELWPPVFEE